MTQFLLFTDGGAFTNANKYFDGVSAYRLLERNTADISESKLYEQYMDYAKERTMAYAEIHAIEKGLERLYNHLNALPKKDRKDHSIIVFTDSMNCCMTLTKWIVNWLRISKKKNKGILYNASGNPVANAKEIVRAYHHLLSIEKLGVAIRLVHINSHITKPGFDEAFKSFCLFNNCTVTKTEFAYFALQNKLCDKALNDYYKKIKTSEAEKNDVNQKDI